MGRIPRYHILADQLRQGIRNGRYPVGALLPTELEICRAEGVSRHTARDALRILIDEGLVERRQGAGTRVVAAERPAAFVQPLGGPQELMQYARDARMAVTQGLKRGLTAEEAAWLETREGELWLVVDGVRRRDRGEVLALTRLYVPQSFMEIEPEIGTWPGAVQELIEQRWGIRPDRIEQRIMAEVLDDEAARALHVRPGGAALRTQRRYIHGASRVIVASDSRHPAERFSLAMTYHRDGA
jgi:GntR family transcriptional regulator